MIYLFANTFNCRGLIFCILILSCSWFFFQKVWVRMHKLKRAPNWYQGWPICTKSIMVHCIKYKLFKIKYYLFLNICFSKFSVAEYRMSSCKEKDSAVQCLIKVSLIADASAVAPDERDQCWSVSVDCTGSTKGTLLTWKVLAFLITDVPSPDV